VLEEAVRPRRSVVVADLDEVLARVEHVHGLAWTAGPVFVARASPVADRMKRVAVLDAGGLDPVERRFLRGRFDQVESFGGCHGGGVDAPHGSVMTDSSSRESVYL
jgi:hypothetical protein